MRVKFLFLLLTLTACEGYESRKPYTLAGGKIVHCSKELYLYNGVFLEDCSEYPGRVWWKAD